MNIINSWWFPFFLAAMIFILGGCGKGKDPYMTPFSVITPDKAVPYYEEAIIVDVRTAEEFSGSHLKNAINIPVDEIETRFAEEVTNDKSKRIFVYCKSGVRAINAMEKLKELGYAKVFSIGGIKDWENSKHTDYIEG